MSVTWRTVVFHVLLWVKTTSRNSFSPSKWTCIFFVFIVPHFLYTVIYHLLECCTKFSIIFNILRNKTLKISEFNFCAAWAVKMCLTECWQMQHVFCVTYIRICILYITFVQWLSTFQEWVKCCSVSWNYCVS
jgi:hypothetical protein